MTGCSGSSTCWEPIAVTIRMEASLPPYFADKPFCAEHGERIVAIVGGKWTAAPVAAP